MTLLLLIKPALIPIRSQQQTRYPRRCPAHLLTDGIQRHFRTALDNQLIVDMPADEAVGQRPHGVGEDVPADRLDDVLHELRTVGLDTTPFLLTVHAHICDALAAELVRAHPGLDVGQFPAGGQSDEQHAALYLEQDISDLLKLTPADCSLHGIVHAPSVLHDLRIGRTPHIHQRLKFIFLKSHLQSSHRLECADRAAVAQGQFRDLAFLAQVGVLAVFLHGNMEHLGCGGAVDIAARAEHLRAPFLSGKVGKHPRLNGREVADDELEAGTGYECRADKLRQHSGDRIIQHVQHFIVYLLYQIPCLFQVSHVVLGKVLQLDQASCPSAGAVGSVERRRPAMNDCMRYTMADEFCYREKQAAEYHM